MSAHSEGGNNLPTPVRQPRSKMIFTFRRAFSNCRRSSSTRGPQLNSKRARYASVDGPTRLRRATSVAERVGALPPHLLRAPRRNLFFPAEFILTMPVLADDSLEGARFHALLAEARRCRACVGLLPFEPARSFKYRDRKRPRL